jgi:hypothetical protein
MEVQLHGESAGTGVGLKVNNVSVPNRGKSTATGHCIMMDSLLAVVANLFRRSVSVELRPIIMIARADGQWRPHTGGLLPHSRENAKTLPCPMPPLSKHFFAPRQPGIHFRCSDVRLWSRDTQGVTVDPLGIDAAVSYRK